MTAERRRAAIRAAFACFAVALFIGTHWPRLSIPGGGRPDLVVHATVFGTWTLLLIACGFFGPALSMRNIVAVGLIAPAYAALDEGLQAIPAIGRTCAWDDYLLNLVGIFAVLGIVLAIARFRAKTLPPMQPEEL